MSNTVTISGNITADPELRFTPSGKAVVNFTVADTPRLPDGKGGWTDGDPLFQRVVAWEHLAEHVAASLRRGDRVIVTGSLEGKSYTKDDPDRLATKVTYSEIRASDVGASLRFAQAALTKPERQS